MVNGDPTEVFSIFCNKKCQETNLWQKGHNDELLRENEKLRSKLSLGSEQAKVYKEKVVSLEKDLKNCKQDLSNQMCASLYHKQKCTELTQELETLSSKFENAY